MLTMPFLKMGETFGSLNLLGTFPNLLNLSKMTEGPHYNIAKFSQHYWVQPVWSQVLGWVESLQIIPDLTLIIAGSSSPP